MARKAKPLPTVATVAQGPIASIGQSDSPQNSDTTRRRQQQLVARLIHRYRITPWHAATVAQLAGIGGHSTW
jgi:hypothetical protein